MDFVLHGAFNGSGDLVGGVGSNNGYGRNIDRFVVGFYPRKLVEWITGVSNAATASIAHSIQTLLQRSALTIAHRVGCVYCARKGGGAKDDERA